MSARSPISESSTPGTRWLRWVIVIHVTAIAICTFASMAYRGFLITPSISNWTSPVLIVLVYPALVPLFVCPALMLLIAIISRGRPNPLWAIVAELLLVVAHLVVVLPFVH